MSVIIIKKIQTLLNIIICTVPLRRNLTTREHACEWLGMNMEQTKNEKRNACGTATECILSCIPCLVLHVHAWHFFPPSLLNLHCTSSLFCIKFLLDANFLWMESLQLSEIYLWYFNPEALLFWSDWVTSNDTLAAKGWSIF